MKLKDILKLVEVHKFMNCMAMNEYKKEGNDEMVIAHNGGVTALEMLRRDLVEEYGEDEDDS